MNILIVKFTEEKKKFIKSILSKTTFKKSNQFEFPNLEKVQKNKIWKNAELVLCYSSPKGLISSKETVREDTSFVLEKGILNSLYKLFSQESQGYKRKFYGNKL